MMSRLTIKFMVILMALAFCNKASSDPGLDSPFSMGAGARELALSGSSSAVCDPVYAAYWNPSVLARAQQFSLTAFHTTLYDPDVTYQYFGLTYPTLDYGSFGVAVLRLGINGIEQRDANNLLLGSFDDSRMALNVAYARKFAGYDLGLAVTLERHSLESYSATSSPGLNLSISRRFNSGMPWLPQITAGINAKNLIRPSIKILNENIKYPYTFDASMAVRLNPMQDWNQNILLTTGIVKEDMVDPHFTAGLEYGLYDLIHLRTSINGEHPSFGVGVSYKSMKFDYALVERDLGSLHMFGITTSLGASVDERRIQRENRREERFNDLMAKSLQDRNVLIISDLFRQAENRMIENQYNEAAGLYERGLFLARTSGLDSSEMYHNAVESNKLLNEIILKQSFEVMMDSAFANYSEGRLLKARYYADRALEKIPESRDANNLLAEIETKIDKTTSTEYLIENQLAMADSLLHYGKIDQAITALHKIQSHADKDGRISSALKRASFEKWRNSAQSFFESGNYQTAGDALDSAARLYPDHPWCADLNLKIKAQRARQAASPKVSSIAGSTNDLDDDLLREVKDSYEKGRNLFKDGKLEGAISQWEKVEKLAPGYLSVREYLVNAYKYLGVELYGKNRLADAVSIWKKAISLDPSNNEIGSYLRRTEAEMNRLQELTYETE